MFVSRSYMPDMNLLRNVALAILAAEMLTIALLIVPGAPRLPTQALLAFLVFVFLTTIIMFRLPLPGILRIAMLVCMVTLLLTVAAKSDPLGLAGTNGQVASALDGAAAGTPSTPDRATGARILIEGSAENRVKQERYIGGPDAEDLTIRAQVTARDGTSRTVRWAIERDGESLPCGRVTVFGDDNEIDAALSVSFKQAINGSVNRREIACY